ncbi:MAG: coproporphyrinogen III oxidase, partial [Planctomycetota bacterium]
MHLPFCVVKCGYCDFHSLADVPELEMGRVVDAILAELEHKRALLHEGAAAYTVFLGGGTPTQLPTSLLARLLNGICNTISVSDLREFTSEANPESLTQEKLDVLAEHGVRRLSLGVQSFDEDRLRFLDRPHDVAGAHAALHRLQEDGRFEFSLDLIYGIPGQSIQDWEEELRQGLAFGSGHLSAYHLSFETGTKLEARRVRGEVQEHDQEKQRSFFECTHDLLAQAGRPAYEISNF